MDHDPASLDPALAQEVDAAALAALLGRDASAAAILEALPVAVYCADADGRLTFYNDAAAALWGVRPPLGDPDWLRSWPIETPDGGPVPPERRPIRLALRGAAADGGRVVAVRADGTRVPVQPLHAPLLGADGAVVGAVAVLVDVTDAHAAEEALRESERHYRHAADLSHQIPWTADASGALVELSDRWRELTGIAPEQAFADGWRGAIHPDDLPGMGEAIARAAAAGGFSARFRVRTRDGTPRWMWSRARPRRDEAGNIVRWYGSVEDIHDRVAAEEARAAGEERLRLAVESTGLGIWDYDVQTGARAWSEELRAMLGLPADAPAELATYLALVHPADRPEVAERYAAALRGEFAHRFAGEYRIRRADTGAERWISTTGRLLRDADGRPRRALVTFSDVTARREAQERVLHAARHDALTGLAGRALFTERLAGLVERGEPFGVLLVDMDHLKRVNDTEGHDAGDAVLRGAADRLRAAAADPGDAARLGGDEFGLVVPGVASPEALAEAAENLRGRLAEPLLAGGRALDSHASIGAALFPAHGRTAGALLKSADVALYAAKTDGRGRAELYDRRMRVGLVRRAGMVKRARDALAAGRIEPHYQPKVDLRTGRVVGFEALLRWVDRRGRLRPPGDIAAAFEDFEVAAELSDRMLGRVVADMGRWRAAGLAFGRVAVNVANAEFVRGDLPARVLGRLDDAGLPAECLELELTETVLLGRRAGEVEETLGALAAAGVRVALDDFGTGFASLVHLRRFPIDVIKVDRSFTAGVDGDPGAAAIVRAVLGLGRDLRLETVAEGVETDGQRRWLAREGCTTGQGYLFGRARPAADVPAMLD